MKNKIARQKPRYRYHLCSEASILFTLFLVLLSSCQHSRESGQGYRKEHQPDTERISGSRNLVQFLGSSSGGAAAAELSVLSLLSLLPVLLLPEVFLATVKPVPAAPSVHTISKV